MSPLWIIIPKLSAFKGEAVMKQNKCRAIGTVETAENWEISAPSKLKIKKKTNVRGQTSSYHDMKRSVNPLLPRQYETGQYCQNQPFLCFGNWPKADNKLRSIYSWKMDRASGKNGSAAFLSGLFPSQPSSQFCPLFYQQGADKKISSLLPMGSNKFWAEGENLQHWQQQRTWQETDGENSHLCKCEDVLLIGVSGEPATYLTENLGMGEPEGWDGLSTHPCWLGNYAHVQEGSRRAR